jgi:protein phosphatase
MVSDMLTIGEFARAARLSAKALRLYDELGLLRPARVDEWTGYRYYSPDQLEQARLVAWLRRLGMPLATIKETAGLPPAEVAAAVAAFLRVSASEFAERERLAQFLIAHLSRGETAMPESAAMHAPLVIRYAAGSDQGLVREVNQDSAYAGPLLLAVADRFGPSSPLLLAVADGFGPGGEQASAAVIDALRGLETRDTAPLSPELRSALSAEGTSVPADLLNALSDVVAEASSSVRSFAAADPAYAASGSTITAMYWTGAQLAMVHIGDGRAYLLRDGGLFQVTHDHSVVQSLLDAGRLTPEEAASHPQRSLLLRALSADAADSPDLATPDLSLHDAQAGDRYLLCSDGLTTAVPVAVIRETLRDAAASPEEVVTRLISLANEAGGPDNIACAVADITEAG